jgi:hypothetical protein
VKVPQNVPTYTHSCICFLCDGKWISKSQGEGTFWHTAQRISVIVS